MNKVKYLLLLLALTANLFSSQLQAMNLTGAGGMLRRIYRSCEPFFRESTKKIVFQEEIDSIKLAPGQNPRILFTRELCGCMATVFCGRTKENNKIGFLSHYYHGNPEHLVQLKQQIKNLHEELGPAEFECAHFLVVLPKFDYFTHDTSGNAKHDAECQEVYDTAEKIVREVSSNVKVVRFDYDIPPPGKIGYSADVHLVLQNEEASYCKIHCSSLNTVKIELE